MMEEIFLKVVNMSVSASWLILVVIALRFLMKKAPKFINCLLWAIVGVRLAVPFSIESVLSLMPSKEALPEHVLTGPHFRVHTGASLVDKPVNDYLDTHYVEGVSAAAESGRQTMQVLAVIWIAGMAALLLYALVSFLRMRRSVQVSMQVEKDVWVCDDESSPFILGAFRPRIYLPSELPEEQTPYILAHERAHLARLDHWWKLIGFVLLAVHWFNPLVWAAYALLCRDIELACDEKVIRNMAAEDKQAYSYALLSCSLPRRSFAAGPLAFGEVGVKERIRSVVNYKKPAFWIVVLAAVSCAVVAVCFLTNPKDREADQSAAAGNDVETLQTAESDVEAEATGNGSASQGSGSVGADTEPREEKDNVALDMDNVIERKLEEIMSSPVTSSNPYDYVKAHRKEVNDLAEMGDITLSYIVRAFESGGETGLRGHVMWVILDSEFLYRDKVEMHIPKIKEAENGQEAYDIWHQVTSNMVFEKGEDYVKDKYPFSLHAFAISNLPKGTKIDEVDADYIQDTQTITYEDVSNIVYDLDIGQLGEYGAFYGSKTDNKWRSQFKEYVAYETFADITHDGTDDKVQTVLYCRDLKKPFDTIETAQVKVFRGKDDGTFEEHARFISCDFAEPHVGNGSVSLARFKGQDFLLFADIYEMQGSADYNYAAVYVDDEKGIRIVESAGIEFTTDGVRTSLTGEKLPRREDVVPDFQRRMTPWILDSEILVCFDVDEQSYISAAEKQYAAAEYFDTAWERKDIYIENAEG